VIWVGFWCHFYGKVKEPNIGCQKPGELNRNPEEFGRSDNTPNRQRGEAQAYRPFLCIRYGQGFIRNVPANAAIKMKATPAWTTSHRKSQQLNKAIHALGFALTLNGTVPSGGAINVGAELIMINVIADHSRFSNSGLSHVLARNLLKSPPLHHK